MPDFALELSFDPSCDASIREQWNLLKAADLPSQADHKSMTNAPHLTLVAASALPTTVRDYARREFESRLPLRLPIAGLVVFGVGNRRTIAHLVEPSPELLELTHSLRGISGPVRHPGWTPHITLARRVPRADIARALDVISELPVPEVIATQLRYWDPEAGSTTELVGPA